MCSAFRCGAVCPVPTDSSPREYFSTELGMVCTGSSLTFHNLYGTLVSILSDLVARGSYVPCIAQIAELASRILDSYVDSFWL
jgi:hypothetical protein